MSQFCVPPVALLTDFGLSDGYVASVKAVILSGFADTRFVDITHEIPTGDVVCAGHTLRETARFFPRHTIFAVIVDPGVGTARRLLAACAEGRYFLAPDNGVLDGVLRTASQSTVRALKWRPPEGIRSRTFHGRDWLAPVAARLLESADFFDGLGPRVKDWVRLPGWFWNYRRQSKRISGNIIHTDRFGNLITSIPESALAKICRSDWSCVIGGPSGVAAQYRPTYGQARRQGAVLWLVNSGGWVEIAAREDSAARILGVHRGDPVALRPSVQVN